MTAVATASCVVHIKHSALCSSSAVCDFYHYLPFSALKSNQFCSSYHQRCWMRERGGITQLLHLWMEQPANSRLLLYLLPEEWVPNGSMGSSFLQERMSSDQSTGWAQGSPDSPPSMNAGGIEVGCRSLTSLRAPSLLRPRPSSCLCVIQTPWSSIQLCRLLFVGGKWGGNNKHRGANGQHKSIPETDRCRGSLRSKKRIPPHPSLSVSGIRTKL